MYLYTQIREASIRVWQIRKILVTVYLFQLAFAAIIGLEVYEVIQASIGDSMVLEEMMKGYNHTALMDLLNVHGASLSPLLGLVRWVVLVYLVFSSFIHAGIFGKLIDPTNSFWTSGAHHFWSFLKLGIIGIIIGLLLTMVLFLPFLSNLFNLLNDWSSEKPIVWTLIGLLVSWFLLLSLLFLWLSRARYWIVKEELGCWSSLKKGAKRLVPRWWQLLPSFLCLALLFVGIYGLNFYLEETVGISSVFLILLFFVMHQLIIFGRLFLGIASYAIVIGSEEDR